MRRTERQVVPSAEVDDVDFGAVRAFMRAQGLETDAAPQPAREDDLRNASVVDEIDGVLRPSLYGLMVFGRDPQAFPHTLNLFVQCAAYGGADQAADVLSASEGRGRLEDQVARAMGWFHSLGRREVYEGLRRRDVPPMPEPALREALVNAVIHRDYAITGSQVLLEVFDDRIVVTSPGALPNHMTVEQARRGGAPRSRNEMMANAMVVRGLMERRGRGWLTMRHAMARFNGTEPELINDERNRFVRVTFSTLRSHEHTETTGRRRTKQRLDKARCSALRRELADLGYGQADHETPELTARNLYPVPEHLRALDPNAVLVVGPRGSGKTALFKAFFSDAPDLVRAVASRMPKMPAPHAQPGAPGWAWVAAHPAGPLFPDTRVLSQCARSDDDAKKIWHAMLVRRLADRLDGRWKETLKPILEPMAAELRDVLAAYDAPETNPTAALDALEQALQQEGRGMFVGYDELDTLGGSDWALMARMVRGLVAFWSDYSRRWKRIRAKIFLRSDLFRRHAGMGTADFAKLAATRAELRWSDAALLGMLVKRVANASGGLAAYCKGARIRFEDDDVLGLLPRIEKPDDAFPLLHRLAGEFMGAGRKKGFVRSWVFAHLRDGNGEISPRSLVRLIEQAADKEAANQSSRPPRLIHPTALRQALDDVSGDHVTQGIRSEWLWLEGVRTRLAEDRLVPWERQRIVALLDADWGGSWGPSDQMIRPPVDRPADLLDYLIEIGVFRRRSDDRVDVTDLYLSGLRLRRKGGVKLGPRRPAPRPARKPPAPGRRREERAP